MSRAKETNHAINAIYYYLTYRKHYDLRDIYVFNVHDVAFIVVNHCHDRNFRQVAEYVTDIKFLPSIDDVAIHGCPTVSKWSGLL